MNNSDKRGGFSFEVLPSPQKQKNKKPDKNKYIYRGLITGRVSSVSHLKTTYLLKKLNQSGRSRNPMVLLTQGKGAVRRCRSTPYPRSLILSSFKSIPFKGKTRNITKNPLVT